MSSVRKLPLVTEADRIFALTGARYPTMCDLHTHTVFCDGKDTPEEMVLSAIERGLSCIGFSAHSYTFFDTGYCLSMEAEEAYLAEVSALREKYRDRIRVLCGVEQDYYSDAPTDSYDYVIGSVHYIRVRGGEKYIAVDETREELLAAADEFFGGDIYALAEEYYKTEAGVVKKTGADIIGHFDLISKFNGDGELFDESNERYRSAWMRAAGELLKTGVPFELNTGAVSRGWRRTPYPAPEIADYIARRGGRFILSSDSHSKETLAFGFEDYK